MALRDGVDQTPPSNGDLPVFRDDMIEAPLRTKPRTREDFLRNVPLELRLETASSEVAKYLDSILAIYVIAFPLMPPSTRRTSIPPAIGEFDADGRHHGEARRSTTKATG